MSTVTSSSGLRHAARAALAAVLDLMLLHLAVERRTVKAENLRGLLLIPVGALQCLQDRHLLDFRQRAMRRNHELARTRALSTQRLRQVVHADLTALRHEHAALDDILDLAYVARPTVPDQHVIR